MYISLFVAILKIHPKNHFSENSNFTRSLSKKLESFLEIREGIYEREREGGGEKERESSFSWPINFFHCVYGPSQNLPKTFFCLNEKYFAFFCRRPGCGLSQAYLQRIICQICPDHRWRKKDFHENIPMLLDEEITTN